MTTAPCLTVNVCGKRTLDYVIEALGKSNASSDGNVKIRAVGSNISKGVGVAALLVNEFDFRVTSTSIAPLTLCGIRSSCLDVELECKLGKLKGQTLVNYWSEDGFVQFPIYHLLLDMVLRQYGEMNITTQSASPLIKICRTGEQYVCTLLNPECDKDLAGRISSAYYRSGLVLSPDWETVGSVLSGFDDVILGLDTNILFDAAASEQILSSIFLIDPREYVHTPNWILAVIPNAVIHELEQAANSRNDYGLLTMAGRLGFRALEEIVELNRSADISGLSVVVAGEASPILDARVELRGLRDDLFVRACSDQAQTPGALPAKSRKTSSGDMIIRAQYKQFLRQIDFHKGVFFLTADKSNAALARAEGLNSIYYKTPPPDSCRRPVSPPSIPCEPHHEPLLLDIMLGRLLYELTVQFGGLRVDWRQGSMQIECDRKGESMDHWLIRDLIVAKTSSLDELLWMYEAAGRISLAHVHKIWSGITQMLLGSDTIIGWGKLVTTQPI